MKMTQAEPQHLRATQPNGPRVRVVRWALLVATLALSVGCEQPGPRVYTAMAYDPVNLCLEPYAPVALVEAEDLGDTCDPVCFTLADTLYVSQVCAPYPTDATLVRAVDSPDCAAALKQVGMDGGACADQSQ